MAINKLLFEAIINQIESHDFENAEIQLKSFVDKTVDISGEDYSYACFLRGYLHTLYQYNDRNKHVAKQMLLQNIESEYPKSNAYCFYADVLEDKNTALNYLKSGLEKFPESADIYFTILKYCTKIEAEQYICEIKEKALKDARLICKVIQTLWEKSSWEKAEYFLNDLIQMTPSDDESLMYYQFLYAFSLIAQRREIEYCKNILFDIISKDLSNRLNYMPYLGYSWCCAVTNAIEEANIHINKIPDTNVLKDFDDGPWWSIYIDLNNILQILFSDIVSNLIDKEIILRVQMLEALYIYSPSEIFDINRFTKKNLATLNRYHRKHGENLEVASAVFYMQKHFKQYFNAYKTFTEMLRNQLRVDEKYLNEIDFLNECSVQEIAQIYEHTTMLLKNKIDMDMACFVELVFDNIIEYLWGTQDKAKYQKIVDLSALIDDYYLKSSKVLFEIAYSYAQLDNKSVKAEKTYNILLQQEPENSSAWNNLGVVFERRNNLEKALEYFKRAYELNSTDEIYENNIKRISESIRNYQNAVYSLEKENSWLLGRLTMLCESSTDSDEFTCTYKNRSSMLNVSPAKGDELFDKFLHEKYIFKISTDGASKYKINPLVKRYLEQQQERLRENKRYEIIGSKLNIDELRKIGYTDEAISAIGRITDETLRGILLRDIHECAVSVIAEQYKSAIIICGSIIEAILVYVTEQKGIVKYDIGTLLRGKAKTRPVKDMDLNELLELGKQERIIDIEEYHLSNYVRAYRNIIHPSCEVRKSYNVDALTTNLMWNALLAVIREVL